MKKKIKNRLAITFGLTAMLGIVTLGVIHDTQQYNNKENIVKVERKVQPKYVSYDDGNEEIQLSDIELVNYSFENLYNYMFENKNNIDNLLEFTFDTNIIENFIMNWSGEYELFYGGNESYVLTLSEGEGAVDYLLDDVYNIDLTEYTFLPYHFYLIDITDQQVYLPTENEDYLVISCVNYTAVKTAIELDIQANQPVNQGESIIGAITSGLGLIPDLANEFLTGFSALFWNSQTSSLTTFSYFALVFLGIAITMAIVKLVLAIIRGNTGA